MSEVTTIQISPEASSFANLSATLACGPLVSEVKKRVGAIE
jgi:hypothetical protein